MYSQAPAFLLGSQEAMRLDSDEDAKFAKDLFSAIRRRTGNALNNQCDTALMATCERAAWLRRYRIEKGRPDKSLDEWCTHALDTANDERLAELIEKLVTHTGQEEYVKFTARDDPLVRGLLVELRTEYKGEIAAFDYESLVAFCRGAVTTVRMDGPGEVGKDRLASICAGVLTKWEKEHVVTLILDRSETLGSYEAETLAEMLVEDRIHRHLEIIPVLDAYDDDDDDEDEAGVDKE